MRNVAALKPWAVHAILDRWIELLDGSWGIGEMHNMEPPDGSAAQQDAGGWLMWAATVGSKVEATPKISVWWEAYPRPAVEMMARAEARLRELLRSRDSARRAEERARKSRSAERRAAYDDLRARRAAIDEAIAEGKAAIRAIGNSQEYKRGMLMLSVMLLKCMEDDHDFACRSKWSMWRGSPGECVRAAAGALGLTAKGLAARLGVSEATVSCWMASAGSRRYREIPDHHKIRLQEMILGTDCL